MVRFRYVPSNRNGGLMHILYRLSHYFLTEDSIQMTLGKLHIQHTGVRQSVG